LRLFQHTFSRHPEIKQINDHDGRQQSYDWQPLTTAIECVDAPESNPPSENHPEYPSVETQKISNTETLNLNASQHGHNEEYTQYFKQ
jgi:hypothetical protein